MVKIVTKTEWNGYRLVSEPTGNVGKVKRDANGDRWEWIASGKRVTIRKVNR